MALESASLLFDRPLLPPWGKLEAIEVPGYPQSHLQVPQPEHHGLLAALVRAELDNPEAPAQEDPAVNRLLGSSVGLEQDEAERLTFYLHEDAWGRDGPMVGCLGLWRTAQEREAGLARIGAFAAHRFERELLVGAAYCLIAHAQETWGWGTLDGITWAPIAYSETSGQNPLLLPPPALPGWSHAVVCPVKSIMAHAQYQWEGARRFYSSESGALSSEWYDESHRLHEALEKDLELCEEGVIVNGMYNLSQLRSFIVPHLQSAIKRGVPVKVNMSEADLSDEYYAYLETSGARALARQLAEMGATVEAQPSRGAHNMRLIIDRRIFYAPAQGLPGEYITRTVAEKQIPLLLIQNRRLV